MAMVGSSLRESCSDCYQLQLEKNKLEKELIALREENKTLKNQLDTKQTKESNNLYGKCPKCKAYLEAATGGGVICANKSCKYWFCY